MCGSTDSGPRYHRPRQPSIRWQQRCETPSQSDLWLADLEATSDAAPGGIVELRGRRFRPSIINRVIEQLIERTPVRPWSSVHPWLRRMLSHAEGRPAQRWVTDLPARGCDWSLATFLQYLSARAQQPLCQAEICSNILCLQNPVHSQMSGIRTRGVVKADTELSDPRMRADQCAHCGHV
jgi:hypothetical protein